MSATTHAPEAEKAIVGCILGGERALASDILTRVPTDCLTHPMAVHAFLVAKEAIRQGLTVDLMAMVQLWPTVTNFPCDLAWLSDCSGEIPSPANAAYYAGQVIEAARRRKIRLAAHALVEAADDAAADVGKALLDVNEAARLQYEQTSIPSKTVVHKVIDDLQARHALNGRLAGISYGFRILDSMTDGMQPGEYIMVGARPSIGKTAFACNLLHSVSVLQGIPSLFLTIESNEVSLCKRLVAIDGAAGARELRSGRFAETEFRRITATAKRIADAPIHWVNGIGGMDGFGAANAIRANVARHGVKVVFLDYVQKLKVGASAEKRTYGIAENSAQLKQAVDETGVALVALAQLNRDAEDPDRIPRIRDLAECSQLERDADTIMLLHRTRDPGNAEAGVIIAKAREGECGAVPMLYHGNHLRFSEPERMKPE